MLRLGLEPRTQRLKAACDTISPSKQKSLTTFQQFGLGTYCHRLPGWPFLRMRVPIASGTKWFLRESNPVLMDVSHPYSQPTQEPKCGKRVLSPRIIVGNDVCYHYIITARVSDRTRTCISLLGRQVHNLYVTLT